MEPKIKQFFIILSIGISIIIIGHFSVLWYVSNAWEVHHRGKIEMVEEAVRQGLDYPENFSVLMDTLRPSTRSMKQIYYEKIFCTLGGLYKYPRRGGVQYKYYSEEVLEILQKKSNQLYDWTNIFDEKMIFAFGLEKRLTPKEIESYFFMNKVVAVKQTDGSYLEKTGIREIASNKFNKPVEALDTSELIELYILTSRGNKFYQENEKKYLYRLEMFERILESYRSGHKKVLN